jgi:hypothetical protein
MSPLAWEAPDQAVLGGEPLGQQGRQVHDRHRGRADQQLLGPLERRPHPQGGDQGGRAGDEPLGRGALEGQHAHGQPNLHHPGAVDQAQRHRPGDRRADDPVPGDQQQVEGDVDDQPDQVVEHVEPGPAGHVQHQPAGTGGGVDELADGQDHGDRRPDREPLAEEGQEVGGEDHQEHERRQGQSDDPALGQLVGVTQALDVAAGVQVGDAGGEGGVDGQHDEGRQMDQARGHVVHADLAAVAEQAEQEDVGPDQRRRGQAGGPAHDGEAEELSGRVGRRRGLRPHDPAEGQRGQRGRAQVAGQQRDHDPAEAHAGHQQGPGQQEAGDRLEDQADQRERLHRPIALGGGQGRVGERRRRQGQGDEL